MESDNYYEHRLYASTVSPKPSVTVYTTASPVYPVPTPMVTTFPTPGTYTQPAVTVHVNSTITVVAHHTTALTPGPNTYGGYTTTVNASTTVTCPYVSSSTSGTVITSFVTQTTYVCPSAGVFTPVAPESTTVSTSTVLVCPSELKGMIHVANLSRSIPFQLHMLREHTQPQPQP
jgi:hypothetical protein